jgi:hypothetical protein
MADRCSLCERSKASSSEFCELHDGASRNLESAYSSWKEAFGGELAKEKYYSQIALLTETGQSVKEVVQHLLGRKGAAT